MDIIHIHIPTTSKSLYITIKRHKQNFFGVWDKNNKYVGYYHNINYKNTNYSLYAVLVHSGPKWKGGHYYALRKCVNNKWLGR